MWIYSPRCVHTRVSVPLSLVGLEEARPLGLVSITLSVPLAPQVPDSPGKCLEEGGCQRFPHLR